MEFQELLGHLRANVLRDRALPELWSDTELKLYLNEAQVEFARRTHCLVDDEAAFTLFETVVGEAQYALDNRILFINTAHVRKPTPDDPGAVPEDWTLMRDYTRGRIPRTITQRRPCAYTAQCNRNSFRLAAPADDVYEIQLMVARKPLAAMVAATDTPEIDEDYHLALVDYAAWRALSNNDPEKANMASGKDFRAAWDLQVRDAKRDIARLHAGATPQARGNWTGKVRRVR